MSTPKAIPGNAFQHHAQYPHLATSPPDQLRKQASLAAAAAAPVSGSPSGPSGTPKNVISGQAKQATSGTPSALGRYYLSASDPQHISKHPQGSISFPDPAMAQYHHPVLPQLSPLLKNRGGNAEASPTLSVASDETFIPAGTSPNASGSMMPQQSLFPPMSKVIPPVAAGPIAQQSQQQYRKMQGQQNTNAFAYKYTPRSGAGGAAENQTGTSPLAQIHQSFAGMPSGPLGSGQAPPRIKPDGTPMLDSPSGGPGADTISGSFTRSIGGIPGTQQQQQRPLLRQSTADSFMSTSSEEEDLSSPMILPDTSLRASDRSGQHQQAGLDSPRFGNGTPATPRGGPVHASPRMGGVGPSGTTAAGGPLFPPLSSVTKVRPTTGLQPSNAATSSSSKFTFQNPASAPVFPPMSPTSSSSGESGDEARTAKRGDKGSGWRFRSKSPFISAPNSQATAVSEEGDQQQDTTDSDTRNGDQGTSGSQEGQGSQTDDEWARYRAGSITVGGIGYGNGGRDDESDEDDDRQRRKPEKVDKKLETNALPTGQARRASGEADRNHGNGKAGQESEEEDDDDDDDEDDDDRSLESEDGYQDATNAAGPFPGGKAVRPPAKRKFPKSSDDKPNSSGEAATTVTRTKKDGTVVRKKRKSAPAEDGDVFCDYVEPLPVSLGDQAVRRFSDVDSLASPLKNALHISIEHTISRVIEKRSTLEMKVVL